MKLLSLLSRCNDAFFSAFEWWVTRGFPGIPFGVSPDDFPTPPIPVYPPDAMP